jgi:hypothetical protein
MRQPGSPAHILGLRLNINIKGNQISPKLVVHRLKVPSAFLGASLPRQGPAFLNIMPWINPTSPRSFRHRSHINIRAPMQISTNHP